MYKLTDHGKMTHDEMFFYSDPHLALMFNPINDDIQNPQLCKFECSEIRTSNGVKFSCKSQTLIEEIDLPILTLNQRIAFAIKCSLSVYENGFFHYWANNWLNGTDRTAHSADAAYDVAYGDVNICAGKLSYAAAHATDVSDSDKAQYAKDCAVIYADYDASRSAISAAISAINATANSNIASAAYATYAAAYAADAAYASGVIDFKSIMQWVLQNIND